MAPSEARSGRGSGAGPKPTGHSLQLSKDAGTDLQLLGVTTPPDYGRQKATLHVGARPFSAIYQKRQIGNLPFKSDVFLIAGPTLAPVVRDADFVWITLRRASGQSDTLIFNVSEMAPIIDDARKQRCF